MADWLKPRIERRLYDRRRTFKGATVVFSDNAAVADCTVRDLSPTGAKLTFKSLPPLPKSFRLVINEVGTFDCEIMRISGLDFGVRFIETPAFDEATPLPAAAATAHLTTK
jgi:hypothetical protein